MRSYITFTGLYKSNTWQGYYPFTNIKSESKTNVQGCEGQDQAKKSVDKRTPMRERPEMARVEAPLSPPSAESSLLLPPAVLEAPGADVLRVEVVPLVVTLVLELVGGGASGRTTVGRSGYKTEEVWVTQFEEAGTRAT